MGECVTVYIAAFSGFQAMMDKRAVALIKEHNNDNKQASNVGHNIPSTPKPTSTFVPMRTCRLSPRHGTANPFRLWTSS